MSSPFAVRTAVFLGNGGQITPTGYDGAMVAALFAPGRVRFSA